MKRNEPATKKRKTQITKSLASLVSLGNKIKATMRYHFQLFNYKRQRQIHWGWFIGIPSNLLILATSDRWN